jgi:hypothetical protein
VAVADSTEEQLSWEARQRPRAAIAAILGAVLTFGADLWSNQIFAGAPRSGLLEALQNAERSGPVGETRSVRDAFYVFYNDHAGEVIAASVVRSIGLIAVGWLLSFLAAAVRARRKELPRAATWLPLVGAVLQAVASLMGTFASASGVSTYLDGPRTVDAASDVTGSSVLVASSFIGLVGQFALAAAFVLICLNALRAGLLTRFMGVVGIFVGVFIIIPLVPLSTLQAFWLVAVAFMLFGVWPGAGVPPAWKTGRAEPWPKAPPAQRGRGRGRPEPAVEGPVEGPVDERPSMAGAARRKRKRRS